MTGFGSAEGQIQGQRYKAELRSVNHRFLDLKVRLPRELSAFDAQVRQLVQGAFSRGSIELKIERISSDTPTDRAGIKVNLVRAKEVFESLQLLRTSLGIHEPVSLREVSQFPEVLQVGEVEVQTSPELIKSEVEQLLGAALANLAKMRTTEGSVLSRILLEGTGEIESLLADIRAKRGRSEDDLRKRSTEKIQRVFEAHPLALSSVQGVLESRIAQELALLLDRTDIQEELHRFEGHIQHFRKTLKDGQSTGKKLEFILQELGREINTLGNKAQDLGISEQVVATKVRLEQLREQVLNLE